MTQNQNILNLAVSTGEALLKNGGEIYRVEDTVSRILERYGIHEYNVYVISNGIFATVNEASDDACHMVRHVPLGGVHLAKISAINQLSREICSGNLTLSQAYEKLEYCKHLPSSRPFVQIFSSGVGSGCFCYLFGGGFLDSCIAFLLGLLLHRYLLYAMKHRVSKFIMNIIGSALVTAGSLLALHVGLPVLQDKVVIGSIIPLVPGVSFTTSIRDFFNGDYLSGAIRMIDALLTALCIAIGVGAAITTYRLLTGGVLLP